MPFVLFLFSKCKGGYCKLINKPSAETAPAANNAKGHVIKYFPMAKPDQKPKQAEQRNKDQRRRQR